jgi:uncharacterized membrane protein
MDLYSIVKTAHIISATVLFGTGLGIANFMFFGHRESEPVKRAFAARMTVRADYMFTLPAVIAQPVTGAWLIALGGFDWTDKWLVATYVLYLLAGACWVPVVAIQLRMKTMLEAAANGEPLDTAVYKRLYRWWFALGWPAFLGLVAVFWLMVAKPTW